MAGVHTSITVTFHKAGVLFKTRVIECGEFQHNRKSFFIDGCDLFGVRFKSEIPTDIEELEDDHVESNPKIVCRLLNSNNESIWERTDDCYFYEKRERIFDATDGYKVDIGLWPEKCIPSSDEETGTRKRKSEVMVPVDNKVPRLGEPLTVLYPVYSAVILEHGRFPVCKVCHSQALEPPLYEFYWGQRWEATSYILSPGDKYPKCRLCGTDFSQLYKDPDERSQDDDATSDSDDEEEPDDVKSSSEDSTDDSDDEEEPDDVKSSSEDSTDDSDDEEEPDDVTSTSEDSTDDSDDDDATGDSDDETGVEGVGEVDNAV